MRVHNGVGADRRILRQVVLTDKRENLRETLSKATEREDSIAKFNVTTGAGHSFASNGSGV